MFLSYALGALILILVLLRQTRVRPVRRTFAPRLPLVVGVIGLFELISYAGNHHVSSSAWAWVVGTMLIGAMGFGALRGLSMRVWASAPWVLRQGGTVTMALWLCSLIAHLIGDAGGPHGGASLQGATFLLYLGLTLGVQGYVVHRRALPLWDALGPAAGRPVRIDFSQGPGTVFTAFWSGGAPASGWQPPPQDDPNVIDAEVVEDEDDGPPELHAPR
jgi:hypothetical protein